MTAATPDQLKIIFEQTLSPDKTTRKTAENHLLQAQQSPGHAVAVLQLVADANASNPAVRQAAAVHFKNLVKNGWDDAESGIVFTDQERVLIKDNLVQLMCELPPSLQAQCCESISLIASHDFPQKWDNLLPDLVQKFGSTNMQVVNGVLVTANSLLKRFRFAQRCDTLYADIIYSLQRLQAPLLTLFQTTSAAVDNLTQDKAQLEPRMESLRLMCRIFFSLNYQDLPEFFEDHMGEWMTEFAKFLKYKNPLLVDDDEETQSSCIDALQAAIVENLYLYADKDEETFINYLPDFTQLVWNLLMGLSSYPKHDVLATKCIRFLSSLVKKQMHRSLFQENATLRQIIGSIVIPNLYIREVDQERFEDDPAEFIATDMEGSESESRRKCSQDLLKSMCRQFEQETTIICYEHVQRMLQDYAKNPADQWAAKDAAIHLMFGISIQAETATHGVSQVNDLPKLMEFFSMQILPELQDSNHTARPMLKSTAVKFVSTFRNQFSKENLVALMPLLIVHLGSPVVVVHTYAAFCIEKILTTRDEQNVIKFGSDELRPLLPTVFAALFDIIENNNNNENEYAMKCIMRALSVAKEDIVPATQAVLDKLTAALGLVAKNPRNPHYNHYLFESIAILVKSVCAKEPSATTSFEHYLFPPFQIILQMDVSEFTPYVFQIFAQLLEYRRPGTGLGDAYSALLQACVNPLTWERKGNIPALTRLLRAYLQQGAEDIVRAGFFLPMLGVWQSLVSKKTSEQNSFELLGSIVRFVPWTSLQPHSTEIFRILFTRLQRADNPRYRRLITNFFALFLGIYGTQTYLDQLNAVQPGVALLIVVQVWLPRLQSDPPTRLEAKLHVVALTKLCCETAELLRDDNTKQLMGQAIAAVVSLVQNPNAMMGHALADEGPVEIEVSYDSAYSVLQFARQPADDPFPDVVDPEGAFCQGLAAISTSQPGQMQAIIQQGLSGVDPKLATGLDSMLKKAGVGLA